MYPRSGGANFPKTGLEVLTPPPHKGTDKVLFLFVFIFVFAVMPTKPR